ncbi:MAG: hypothetical protein KBT77_13235 [Thalassolituus oleivorans]|uniref:DsrH/TusB family sulfur relay protein n=1 Tax=Thalassolituus oleivorans TaxID=187493 RepID=UPI001B404C08|nr:DsrH/TusB family sulfur metabolism protein [Thalassolituus oleivorans]MBQ0728302.1 hypothetical protein [Thalassolituus oleivorans]MBQ0782279.1 hypothetical protein [Thalassolituus oleivorans]
MILHQILSGKTQTLTDLSTVLNPHDGLILIGDGCYQISNRKLTTMTSNIFARTQDVDCRGLANLAQETDLKLINDVEWVGLTLRFNKVVSWK